MCAAPEHWAPFQHCEGVAFPLKIPCLCAYAVSECTASVASCICERTGISARVIMVRHLDIRMGGFEGNTSMCMSTAGTLLRCSLTMSPLRHVSLGSLEMQAAVPAGAGIVQAAVPAGHHEN
eukprot:1158673-Pelagomonas_calceolata.AAC.2